MVPPHDDRAREVTGLLSPAAHRVTARARPWAQDAHVALLTMTGPVTASLAVDVPLWMSQLADGGYRRVRTWAMDPVTAAVFQRHGFRVVQQLTVLTLGPVALEHGPPQKPATWHVRTLRWGTESLQVRRRITEMLEVDRRAFGDEWSLDSEAWREALRATPRHHVAYVRQPVTGVIGMALSGLHGHDGFLQRLAVHPDHQRRGVARALIHDTIRWVARHGARQLLVNTSAQNSAALALYESLGFRPRPEGLVVLEAVLTDTTEVLP